MLETIKAIDTSIFLFINGHHSPYFDQVMWLASDTYTWIPLYGWFLWLLFRENRQKFWLVLLTITMMIVVSDQLCTFSKEFFMRLRPSNEPSLQHLVHIINGYTGGSYGFYSSHASNSFTVATFMTGMIEKGRKFIIPLAFSYALITSYSRMYLGVHYPGDILTGAIAGCLIGWGMCRFYYWLDRKLDDRRLSENTGRLKGQ